MSDAEMTRNPIITSSDLHRRFAEVWFIDTEFRAPDGERQTPVCLVAHELYRGRTVRYWQDELCRMRSPPFEIGRDRLFVCYYAIAEVSTFIALGWTPPCNILDLFCEFRNATNGLHLEHGNGLLSALEFHGLPSMSATEKGACRRLIMDKTSWNEAERRRILDYCEADTAALVQLLDRMWPRINIAEALIRGAYMRALAFVEWESLPVDRSLYRELSTNWSALKLALISQVDPHYQVFVGTRFVTTLFEVYLQRHRMIWPRLSSGALCLDKTTFRDMVKLYPQLNALHELRSTLAKARLSDLCIGSDGRNRAGLSAFRTITSRNAPRASLYVFGPATWLRALIRPPEGYGLAYCDWSGQEFGLGAAHAGDEVMMADYTTGDPYIAFAKRQRFVPFDADKDSHPIIREMCKTLTLGLSYGMSDFGLAQRLDIAEIEAKELSGRQRQSYTKFWNYTEQVVHTGMQGIPLYSVFGFQRLITSDTRPRSLRNWMPQTNGAEMLRLAIVAGIEAGLCIVAPVHDATMLLSPLDCLEEDARHLQAIMVRASEIVTGGFPLRVDVKLVRYPDRYSDKRGVEMWGRAMKAMDQISRFPDQNIIVTEEEDEDAAETAGLGAFVGNWK